MSVQASIPSPDALPWRDAGPDASELDLAGERLAVRLDRGGWLYSLNGEAIDLRDVQTVGDLSAAKTIAPYVVGKYLGALAQEAQVRVVRVATAIRAAHAAHIAKGGGR